MNAEEVLGQNPIGEFRTVRVRSVSELRVWAVERSQEYARQYGSGDLDTILADAAKIEDYVLGTMLNLEHTQNG